MHTQIQNAVQGSGIEVIRAKKLEGVSTTTLVTPTLAIMNFRKKSDSGSDIDSPLVQEEIFGPVMTARKFHDISEVISKVNASPYGLQAGVYTENWPIIARLYQELEVGGLVVNDVPTTRYDHQPYGGVKESGQGREGVKYAMEEMTESKFLALAEFR